MHAEPPHPPAPPEPARLLPPPAPLARGLGLVALVVATLTAAGALLRISAWLAPLSLFLGAAAALAAWGAAVQLTGGEKVDDHPWV